MSEEILRFRSKMDAWLVILLSMSLVLPILLLVWMALTADAGSSGAVAMVAVILVASAALTGWIFATTDYVLSPTELRVRSGPMSWRVPLSEMRSIRKTRSLWSAPALSLDRLEVVYGRAGSVVISPADQDGFLAAVRRYAPDVTIEGNSG